MCSPSDIFNEIYIIPTGKHRQMAPHYKPFVEACNRPHVANDPETLSATGSTRRNSSVHGCSGSTSLLTGINTCSFKHWTVDNEMGTMSGQINEGKAS